MEDEAAEVVFEMVLLSSLSLLLVDVVIVGVDVLVEVRIDEELVDDIEPRSSEVELLKVLGNVVDVEVTTGASVELEVEVLVLATGVLVNVEVLVPVSEVVVEVEIDAENRSPPKTT